MDKLIEKRKEIYLLTRKLYWTRSRLDYFEKKRELEKLKGEINNER